MFVTHCFAYEKVEPRVNSCGSLNTVILTEKQSHDSIAFVLNDIQLADLERCITLYRAAKKEGAA